MPRLGRKLEHVPLWVMNQLDGLVAAMIVRSMTGQDALYYILKDEAETLIEYWELNPDEVYGMYGDPEDPDVQARARERLEEGSFIAPGSYLGIMVPGREAPGQYGICKIKNVDPASDRRGTVNGFIYVAPQSMILHYALRFVDGKFRTLKFDDECVVVESFQSVVVALESAQVTSDIRSLCIDGVHWDDVIDAVLADIRGVSRGEARKRMASVVTEHRDKCLRVEV